jgi:hypothetical protein
MSADTVLMIAGIVTAALTISAFWYLWPQHGKSHPLLRARLEPYIMVALTTGLVLGTGMFFAGLVPG